MDVSEEQIKHRQELFCLTLKSCFLAKITKYQNLLRKHVYIDDSQELGSQLSDDEIELILGASHQYKPRFSCRQLGLGSAGLFRWVLYLIQKVKARRILAHITGVPYASVKVTILDIAREISVAYEYQLVMLYGEEEIIRLAQHAVSIFMSYLNQTEARFTAASLLQALLEIKPKCSKRKEIVRTQTAIWNDESVCYKWKLGQIFKQPGLRIIKTNSQLNRHETDNTKQGQSPGLSSSSVQKGTLELEEGVDEIDCAGVTSELNLFEAATYHSPCRSNLQGELSVLASNSEVQATLVLEDSVDEVLDCARVASELPLFNEKNDVKTIRKCQIELDKVSSVILGHQYSSRDKSQIEHFESSSQRRISTLDMDFEQGTLNINEYEIELNSDFSPVSPDDAEKIDIKRDDLTDDNENEFQTIPKIINEEFQTNISQTIPSSFNKDHLFTQETYPNGAKAIDMIVEEKFKPGVNREDENKSNENIEGKKLSKIDLNSQSNESSQTCAISLLRESSCSNATYRFYGCFTPYGAKCQPSIYGFRGPLHMWDDNEMKWTLIYNDQVSIHETHCNEIKATNCFHQKYRPRTSFHHSPPC